MNLYIAAIRIIHIFAGVFWIGTLWITASFLVPASQAIGSDAQKFMSYVMVQRRLPTVIAAAAGLNILAGLLLYWQDSAGLSLNWITTPTGLGFTFGALCAIAGFIVGFGVVKPMNEQLGRLGGEMQRAGKPPSSEQLAALHRLQASLNRANLITVVFLSLALLAMAVSRYL